MIRVFLAALVFFSAVLYFIPRGGIDGAPSIQYLWQYDLSEGLAPAQPPGIEAGALNFNAVLFSEGEERFIVGPGGSRVPIESGDRVFVPFLGHGYFRYARLGRQVAFHSARGEELWVKDFISYPISDERGELVLLLTGDNNRVDLIDQNGNATGSGSVAGSFMTDFDFAARAPAALIAFAGGGIHLLDAAGNVLWHERLEGENESGPFFVKSAALGPDGRLMAVHYQDGGNDLIALLAMDADGDVSEERLFELPRTYPHLLHMAVNSGGVLVAAPDRTVFVSLGAGADWEAPLSGERIYRPVFADREFFVFGEHETLVVLSTRGERLAAYPVATAPESDWRILPAAGERIFAIQTPARLEFYGFQPAPE